MALRNALLDPATLPEPEPLRLQPVARNYRHYRMSSLTLRWIVAGVALAGLLPALDDPPPALAFWPLFWVAVVAAHLGLAWREARARAWGLREHDLLYASGLFARRLTALPYNRIQHVETLSGPLERGFGLVRVTCFTAGGLSADLVIRGLARDDAERVRQHLLHKIRDEDAEDQGTLAAEVEPS